MDREEKEALLTEAWVRTHASHIEIRDDIHAATGHFLEESVEDLLGPLSDAEINQLIALL